MHEDSPLDERSRIESKRGSKGRLEAVKLRGFDLGGEVNNSPE